MGLSPSPAGSDADSRWLHQNRLAGPGRCQRLGESAVGVGKLAGGAIRIQLPWPSTCPVSTLGSARTCPHDGRVLPASSLPNLRSCPFPILGSCPFPEPGSPTGFATFRLRGSKFKQGQRRSWEGLGDSGRQPKTSYRADQKQSPELCQLPPGSGLSPGAGGPPGPRLGAPWGCPVSGCRSLALPAC